MSYVTHTAADSPFGHLRYAVRTLAFIGLAETTIPSDEIGEALRSGNAGLWANIVDTMESKREFFDFQRGTYDHAAVWRITWFAIRVVLSFVRRMRYLALLAERSATDDTHAPLQPVPRLTLAPVHARCRNKRRPAPVARATPRRTTRRCRGVPDARPATVGGAR
jgi:hypothetical protein